MPLGHQYLHANLESAFLKHAFPSKLVIQPGGSVHLVLKFLHIHGSDETYCDHLNYGDVESDRWLTRLLVVWECRMCSILITRLTAGRKKNQNSIVCGREFSSYHGVHTGPGAQRAFCPIGRKMLFPWK
jgi:hypothetical protein